MSSSEPKRRGVVADAAALMPTREQERAIQRIDRARAAGEREFRLGGLAGTGKTYVAAHLPSMLDLDNVGYGAPTAKAARVLGGKLASVGVDAAPSTIHHLIYSPYKVHCRDCPARLGDEDRCHGERRPCGCKTKWAPKPPTTQYSTLIIDESSMVDQRMYSDLCAAYPRAFKVFVGDHFQLPPVNDKFRLMDGANVRLERVHRQVAGSPILKLAMRVRRGEPLSMGVWGRTVSRDRPTGLPIGREAYDDDALILCYTNATRVRFNKEARKRFGFRADRPEAGDRLICRSNNHEVGIINGQCGTVLTVEDAEHSWLLAARLDDGERYEGLALKAQFNSEYKQQWRRGIDLWDYGYALTVHNAQGSEASRVLLIEERPRARLSADEWNRWLYTAITRAKEELTVLVNGHVR